MKGSPEATVLNVSIAQRHVGIRAILTPFISTLFNKKTLYISKIKFYIDFKILSLYSM